MAVLDLIHYRCSRVLWITECRRALYGIHSSRGVRKQSPRVCESQNSRKGRTGEGVAVILCKGPRIEVRAKSQRIFRKSLKNPKNPDFLRFIWAAKTRFLLSSAKSRISCANQIPITPSQFSVISILDSQIILNLLGMYAVFSRSKNPKSRSNRPRDVYELGMTLESV